MPSILPITDDLLIDAMQRATQSVVLITPGVFPPVAKAIADAWLRLGPEKVTVILDVDPEICRIGYGSLEGLQILQKAATAMGEPIGQEPGIRICLFIVDDRTFIFSPSPRQLEPPPGESSTGETSQPKANGIVLPSLPDSLAEELGRGAEGIEGRKFGLESLSQQLMSKITDDLAKNPPKNFDLSRAVNVYNAKIQFVELKVTGCRLSEHKAQLPKNLLHVLKKNPALSQKIENSIRLLDSEDVLVTDPKLSQDSISKHRDEIDSKYLHPVRGVGTVIARSEKADYLKDIDNLVAEVARFAKDVEEKLAARFQNTAEQLAVELLDEVLADPPQKWRKKLGPRPDPERVRWLILEDLLKSFGTPTGKVKKMSVTTVFKDVTYDMLKDADFQVQIAKYFPDLPVMEEFKAVKERSNLVQNLL